MNSGVQSKVFGLPPKAGIAVLSVLGVLLLYAFYSNVLAGPTVPAGAGSSSSIAVAPAPSIPVSTAGNESPRRSTGQRRNSEEFNPPLHSKRPEDRIDPGRVDPSLRLDLLAKVQAVQLAGSSRNLFQVGEPPKPVELPKEKEPVFKPIGPAPPPRRVEMTDSAPTAPPAPPVQLKFYGLSTIVRNKKRTAYFMDGEDITVAAEGELVSRRYRVLRIQDTTVQVEDVEAKRTITLPIVEPTQN